ncbi:hypothetical protein K3555_16645 [Leisingera sp. M527]|uniref:hypothetical protein n=1 Tax=Leisingera sp. M527 TaxID=2867014 RepID=UPI0021A805AD|nr:hypothetical protein [Leisingera sp. M527]UWQ32177.1 hypothetical protein K3555_16645 [Leisingera sp. M527]
MPAADKRPLCRHGRRVFALVANGHSPPDLGMLPTRSDLHIVSASGWLEPIATGLEQAGAGFSVLYCRMAAVEPNLPLGFFRCARSQQQNRRDCIILAPLRGVKTSRSSMLQRDLSPEFTGGGLCRPSKSGYTCKNASNTASFVLSKSGKNYDCYSHIKN